MPSALRKINDQRLALEKRKTRIENFNSHSLATQSVSWFVFFRECSFCPLVFHSFSILRSIPHPFPPLHRCVTNEKLISPFRGTYNTDDGHQVSLYAYLKAFRFTGSPALYLECDIHMCHNKCPVSEIW